MGGMLSSSRQPTQSEPRQSNCNDCFFELKQLKKKYNNIPIANAIAVPTEVRATGTFTPSIKYGRPSSIFIDPDGNVIQTPKIKTPVKNKNRWGFSVGGKRKSQRYRNKTHNTRRR